MLFSSYFIEYDSEKTKALLNCALVALIVHIVAIVVATVIIPKKNNPDYGYRIGNRYVFRRKFG